MKKAFTLIELMIVVAVLGILAAIVVPQLQGNTLQAKESTARDSLAALRTQIELYKLEHNGKLPGYRGAMAVAEPTCVQQFEYTTSATGFLSGTTTPSSGFPYGPYVRKFPSNPLNTAGDPDAIKYVPLATAFAAAADNSTGWLYKRETGEIRLNTTGTDNSSVAYTEY